MVSQDEQAQQAIPGSEPVKKQRLSNPATSCPVAYIKQGERPLFRTTADGTRLGPGSKDDLLDVVSPGNALDEDILAEEIAALGEKLFFLDGLECSYEAGSLHFNFEHCHSQNSSLSVLEKLLGSSLLQNREAGSSYPKHLGIDLGLGLASYYLDGEKHTFFVNVASNTPLECLTNIYLLLMQRLLGETLYNHQMLEQLQNTLAGDQERKKELLSLISQGDDAGIEDSERLGFRIQLSSQGDGIHFSLSDINPDVAMKVWGASDPEVLQQKVADLLKSSIAGNSSSDQPGTLIPFPLHKLAEHTTEQHHSMDTGTAFLDEKGRILRMPLVKRIGTPGSSYQGEKPTRLCPMLSTMVNAWETSAILPGNLNHWFEHKQVLLTKPKAPAPSRAPDINWQDLSPFQRTVSSENQIKSGEYYDTRTNQRWHIRIYDDEERARNEILALKLYQTAGVKVADRHFVRLNGKPCTVAPKEIFDSENDHVSGQKRHSQMSEDLVVDAWLANWCACAPSRFRFLEGQPVRIDCSAALRYRQAGGQKWSDFGHHVGELDTFFDDKLNLWTSYTFDVATRQQKLSAAARIASIPPETIESLVREYGPKSTEQQDELLSTLLARQKYIVQKFPGAKRVLMTSHIVEPGGYEMPGGLMDTSEGETSLPGGNHWNWVDPSKFATVQGMKRLDSTWNDGVKEGIASYLHFEQDRITTALLPRFPGLTVETTQPGGQVILQAKDECQAKEVSSWLDKQGSSELYKLSGNTLTVKLSPFNFYQAVVVQNKVFGSESTPAFDPRSLQSVGNHLASQHYALYPGMPRTETEEEPMAIDQALRSLQSTRDRVAVAAVYRDSFQNPKADIPTELTSFDDLVAVHTTPSGEGLYCSRSSGQWFKARPCTNPSAARNEVLMGYLARASGVLVPEHQLLKHQGQSWVITPWVEGVDTSFPVLEKADKAALARLYLAAAWLGNLNAIGEGFDHAAVDDQGRLHSFNWGGAGYFNASRKRKRIDGNGEGGFTGSVPELNDLGLGLVFDQLGQADIEQAVPDFLEKATAQLETLVQQFGPPKDDERRYLLSTLAERLGAIATRFPKGLPPMTEAELVAVKANGLNGYELPVTSPHLEGQSVLVGHLTNEQGVNETQISLRLDNEKCSWLANTLGLGRSHYDLTERIEFCVEQCRYIRNATMTQTFFETLSDTIDQANQLYKALVDYQKKIISGQPLEYQVTSPEGPLDAQAVEAELGRLGAFIDAMEKQLRTEFGKPLSDLSVEGYGFAPLPDFEQFLPNKTKKMLERPQYTVENGKWAALPSKRCNISGNAFFHQVILEPGDLPSYGLPQPQQRIVLEFHGPDCDATSFEGVVRLVTEGQDLDAANCLLQWLHKVGIGLELRRPNSSEMQYGYEKQLADRPDKHFVSLKEAPRWDQHIHRHHGRMVPMLPKEWRLRENQGNELRATHNVNYGCQSNTMEDIINRDAVFLPFTGRTLAGGNPDAIYNPGNVQSNGAKLVYAHLRERRSASKAPQVVLRPLTFNRVTHKPMTDGQKNQPWRQRNVALPLTKWSQCAGGGSHSNIEGPVSLPESVEHFVVRNEFERAKGLKTIKQRFDVWPDGREPEELFRTVTDLDDLYTEMTTASESGQYTDKLQKLIKTVGFSQFRQLLTQNPQFQSGRLQEVNLEGIKVDNYLELNNVKILSLRNSSLPYSVFKDCQVAGADLGDGKEVNDIDWKFSSPRQSTKDIDYLVQHLQEQLIQTGSPNTFYPLAKLLLNTNREEALCQLLKHYGTKLDDRDFDFYIQRLLEKENLDYPALVSALNDREPSPDIIKTCLQLSKKISPSSVREQVRRADIGMLCKVSNQLEDEGLKKACFDRIQQHINATGNYALLDSLSTSSFVGLYHELKQWVADKPNPKLYRFLINMVRYSLGGLEVTNLPIPGTYLQENLRLLKEATERFPRNAILRGISILDVSGIYTLGDFKAIQVFELDGKHAP